MKARRVISLAPCNVKRCIYCFLSCYIPAIVNIAPDVRRQPLASLTQPQSDPPPQQQQHHSLSQQSRQAAGAQQPVVHKQSQHQPPQQQQRQPQQLQQAQQQQQKRRVREDENSVIVRGNRYTKLECVGRGGSSKVFKVRFFTIVHAFVLKALSRGEHAEGLYNIRAHAETSLQHLLAWVSAGSTTML